MTVGEHRPLSEPFVACAVLQRLEEGTIPALAEPEAAAALRPRRNLSERHVYDQLPQYAAKDGEASLVGKLCLPQEDRDQTMRCLTDGRPRYGRSQSSLGSQASDL